MATAPATALVAKPSAFEIELQQYEPQLRAALPSHIPVERFKRTFITALNQNPDLARAERRTLFTALVKCAQDGLLPDGREAALVVYSGRVSYLPMVAGIIKRMRNSGDLAAISAHVVYTNDLFTYELGDEEHIKHVPAMGDRGKPIGAYAIAKLKSGETQREFMSLAQIEAVRKVSRASKGPWFDWWDEMARKSSVKRLAKYLPMSADIQDLIQRDDDADRLEPEKPRSRLAAVIAEPEPEPAIVTESEPAAESESPTQEAAADQGPAGTQAPPASGHDPETGEVSEPPPPPTIATPPANAMPKAWGNYRAQIIEAIKTAPSRTWLAEFEQANQEGLAKLTMDFPQSGKQVRDAIVSRAQELEQ